MSYVNGTLSKDEEIKEKAQLHWTNFISTYIFGIVSTILWIACYLSVEPHNLSFGCVAGFFSLCFFYKILVFSSIEMVITNKRVIYKTGIISIKTEELKASKVEAIEISQSVLGRILGYGNISFTGTGISVVDFIGIDDPWNFKSRAETAIGD